MAKKKVYAVARGRRTGVFDKWFGSGGAFEQVDGFAGAVFKGFSDLAAAEKWLSGVGKISGGKAPGKKRPAKSRAPLQTAVSPEDALIISPAGGRLGNPGPGGGGAVILDGGKREELSGGYRLTTNNRMELTACIMALKQLKRPSSVIMHSDSKYVVDGIMKGWAVGWRARGWMRTKTEKAKNADLWAELLSLCEGHRVEFRWVKGHAGIEENERCDFLANQEQAKSGLPADKAYEASAGSPT
jgi:ribonuclease HI